MGLSGIHSPVLRVLFQFCKRAFFVVEPHHDQLVEIAKLIDAGDLRIIVDTVVPLSRASDAYAGRLERSGRGKLVITMGGAETWA
jgi:NADPH:quinone reductase-like Zn-dependent oxidoreductase